jgi:hypothetical protein
LDKEDNISVLIKEYGDVVNSILDYTIITDDSVVNIFQYTYWFLCIGRYHVQEERDNKISLFLDIYIHSHSWTNSYGYGYDCGNEEY